MLVVEPGIYDEFWKQSMELINDGWKTEKVGVVEDGTIYYIFYKHA